MQIYTYRTSTGPAAPTATGEPSSSRENYVPPRDNLQGSFEATVPPGGVADLSCAITSR